MRVFPISDWTELDVWNYILRENIKVSPLYFAKERPIVWRGDQMIMVDDERYPLKDGETPEMRKIRFRTLGCYPLTAGVDSNATTMEEVVKEVTEMKLSERATRLIDGDKEDSNRQRGFFRQAQNATFWGPQIQTSKTTSNSKNGVDSPAEKLS